MLTSLLLSCAATLAPTGQDLIPQNYLTIAPVDTRGRRPFRPDAVFLRHIWKTQSPAPVQGEVLVGERGQEQTWTRVRATEDGKIPGRIGYAYTRVEVPHRTLFLAKLSGAATLYVNGRAFTGDYYGFGFGGVPVVLEPGVNHVYLTGARGNTKLQFLDVEAGLHHGGWDDTVPHLVAGSTPSGAVGIELANVSERATGKLLIDYEGDFIAKNQILFDGLAPLGVDQFALPLRGDPIDGDWDLEQEIELKVRITHAALVGSPNQPAQITSFSVPIQVRGKGDKVLRTYVSDVDRSVQGYALVPPSEPERAMTSSEEPFLGMVLSLHGASVTAWRQASCYQPRSDFWLVAPSNRRAYGFDWQDWGRRDAYDVLDLALAESGVDPRHTFVTGHSMGGHGTWHLAANDGDKFAGAAPSAGWESFDSYGGRPDGELRDLWHGADGSSRTLDLIGNLKQLPVYVLHGTADKTVPASEALTMMSALSAADGTFKSHFEGGAGHWWGNKCMDWPPIFEYFRGKRIPQGLTEIEFTSVSPDVDAQHHWLRVEQPVEYGRPMHMTGSWDEESKRAVLTTDNVGLFRVDQPAQEVELDGLSLRVQPRKGGLWFERTGDRWTQRTGGPTAAEKSSRRSGTLKRAFDHRFLMVVGTGGSRVETKALGERAAFDAAVWRYRGNGRAEIWSDVEFAARTTDAVGRNVILYGNRDNNSAWSALLDETCPIDVRAGSVELTHKDGSHERFQGGDLGCVFVYPRKGSGHNLVGVFGDAGVMATRVGSTLAPFVSGVGYPDYALYDSRVLSRGDGGVLRAGWLDADWALPGPSIER